MRTSFKVKGKGQGHQADIMLRPEVRRPRARCIDQVRRDSNTSKWNSGGMPVMVLERRNDPRRLRDHEVDELDDKLLELRNSVSIRPTRRDVEKRTAPHCCYAYRRRLV